MKYLTIAKSRGINLILLQRDDGFMDIVDSKGNLVETQLDADSALSIIESSTTRYIFCHQRVCDVIENGVIKDVIPLD